MINAKNQKTIKLFKKNKLFKKKTHTPTLVEAALYSYIPAMMYNYKKLPISMNF